MMSDDEDDAVRQAEASRRLLEEELAFVMGSDVGRRFLARVCFQMCGSDVSSFSVDAVFSAYAQGRRDLGDELRRLARDFNLGLFLKMEEEFYGR